MVSESTGTLAKELVRLSFEDYARQRERRALSGMSSIVMHPIPRSRRRRAKGWLPENTRIDRAWARPPVPNDAVPRTGQRVVMMHTDTTYRVDWNTHRPTIELHGITEHGNSVLVNVHGFNPHFSVEIPDRQEPSIHGNESEYRPEEIISALTTKLVEVVHRKDKKFDTDAIPIVRDYRVEQKENVLNFKGLGQSRRFLKIWLTKPSHIPMARTLFEKGHLQVNGRRVPAATTYEANIRYILRFMVDRRINGCQWISLDHVRVVPYGTDRKSRAQIELQVAPTDVNPISLDERPDVAPLRIMSFDIECITQHGESRFPDAEMDPCIQIAAVVQALGDDEKHPAQQYLWTTIPQNATDGVGPVTGTDGRPATVYVFQDERELLCSWARFMRACDPDIVTGYNIMNFDLPYLIGRVETLKIDPSAGLDWSRIIGYKIRARPHRFQSSAFGTKETFLVGMPGRTNFDMFQWVGREMKLRSYSLNAVSKEVLGDQKEDVPHYMIRPLYLESAEGRARVGMYCIKDAILPLWILKTMLSVVNYIEMVRVVGVPLCWLLERGQMAKTRSRILRAAQDAKPHPYMLPSKVQQPRKYRGAIVVEPFKGYYTDPVIVLDFASLYPSIMIAYNICYTTWFWIDQAEALGLRPDDYIVPPLDWTKEVDQETNKEIPAKGGHRRQFGFVKAHIRKGLLPQILEDVLGERKKAKGEKREAFEKGNVSLGQVYDGKQLALKITANSTYGFTGGMMMPNTCIAESVTAIGRNMITDTTDMVEKRFNTRCYDRGDCQAKNMPEEWCGGDVDPRMVAGVRRYEIDAKVVYGDTDSVMVLWKGGTIERALQVGKEMSAYCRQFYVKPNDLELENVYNPFLLLEKKKYAALLWTNPEAYDKVQIKGLEGARRDWTPMTVKLEKQVLKTLMHNKDIPKVKKLIHQTCEDLLMNRMDVSNLVITKGFTRPLEDYKQPYPAHIQQVLRMQRRDPTTAPKVGSRVASVIVQKAKHVKMGERMEDPLYVMRNNIPIDGMHYIKKQLVGPFVRLLNPVFADTQAERNDVDGYYKKKPERTTAYKQLFTGPHMGKRVQIIPKTGAKGSIVGFITRRPTCVVCRKPAVRSTMTPNVYSALCDDQECMDKSHAVFTRYCADVNTKAQNREATRQICVDCQDDMPYEDIICEAKSCENWYTRFKAQIDYDDALGEKQRYMDIKPEDLEW